MDEMERAVGGYISDDSDMVDVLATTSEEHEVAGLQLALLDDSLALVVLFLRRAMQGDAEPAEDIAGEARAIESRRSAAAVTVAGTEVLFGGAEEISDGQTFVRRFTYRFHLINHGFHGRCHIELGEGCIVNGRHARLNARRSGHSIWRQGLNAMTIGGVRKAYSAEKKQ